MNSDALMVRSLINRLRKGERRLPLSLVVSYALKQRPIPTPRQMRHELQRDSIVSRGAVAFAIRKLAWER